MEGAGNSLSRKALSPLSQHFRSESEIFPYVGDNPFYVDVVSKERAEARPTGGKLDRFQEFFSSHVCWENPTKTPLSTLIVLDIPVTQGGVRLLINPLGPPTEE